MSSRLVNVRLDEERVRKAKELREKGIALSDLVRTAIDERYEKLSASRKPLDVDAIMADLDAKYPLDKKDFPPQSYNIHDRKQLSAMIRKRLKQKRSRAS